MSAVDGISNQNINLPNQNTTTTNDNLSAVTTTVGDSNLHQHLGLCRYFLRGTCRYGVNCRFSHNVDSSNDAGDLNVNNDLNTEDLQTKPGTSRNNWVNAPVFVPSASSYCNGIPPGEEGNKSWAEIVGGNMSENEMVIAESSPTDSVCPFESPCPYRTYCVYGVHLEQCKLCDQYCLHPTDIVQRRKHNQECLLQHEQAMELSFAIARSKDKTCGICFDTIMEKSGREKRFGILPNCSHIFCLECIRTWRQAKQFEHKITRSCPECRVSSDFVCPSAFWVETKEEKDKLLTDYRSALGVKDCKYFKKGDGKCPFGNKCFYKHALPSGELVDVGCPKRTRRMRNSTNEFMNLIDIYLWEFIEQRDYHWLELLSGTSDDGDDISNDDD